jgi:hypothetical protein
VLILQKPLTHDGCLIIHEKEAELEESETELGNFGGNAAGFVEQAVAQVAALPCNSQFAEGIVAVGAGKHYTRVGQLVGAVDVVVEEEAAGGGSLARVLLAWAEI